MPEKTWPSMEEFVMHEQELLWNEFLPAIDRTYEGLWSPKSDELFNRIVTAAHLIRPTPYDQVPWLLLAGGVYHAVLMAAALPVPEITEEQWAAMEEQHQAFRNRDTLVEHFLNTTMHIFSFGEEWRKAHGLVA